MLMK